MRRNKVLLLVASAATLVVLAVAAWDENVDREWRRLQRAYAGRAGWPEFSVMLRQVVAPRPPRWTGA